MKVRPLASVALGASLLVALQAAAIFTVALNWDEFVLFERTARTLSEGVLRSGGHAGLAELALAPLVEGCRDEIAVGRAARAIWLVLTLAFLTGLGVLLAALLRGRAHRLHDAALGVALLALLPAFLEWSLQVRTDQLALATGVWGGVALLVSQRKPALALAAGLAFGVGWLGTQKAAYVAALMGLLALGQLFAARSWRPRRELLRAALCAAAFASIQLAYRFSVGAVLALPEAHVAKRALEPRVVGNYLDIFDFYRHTIGYGQYLELLPTLMPHLLLFALALAAGALAVKRRVREDALVLALAVGVLGIGIGAFHAAAFSYFWMTLGLFPAVALALALQPIREQVAPGRERWLKPASAALWVALLIPTGLHATAQLGDGSQAVQRESLAFVHRNFSAEDAGFHPESGLFCGPAQPLGTWLSQRIYRRFGGGRGGVAWLERFRSEPVHYLVESFRLNQFPVEMRRFWAENYQPYRASVFVAGRHLAGRRGETREFEILFEGRYRWLPFDGPQALRIDERIVEAGGTIALEPKIHRAVFVDDVPAGMLVLAVNEPPGPAPIPFYKSY